MKWIELATLINRIFNLLGSERVKVFGIKLFDRLIRIHSSNRFSYCLQETIKPHSHGSETLKDTVSRSFKSSIFKYLIPCGLIIRLLYLLHHQQFASEYEIWLKSHFAFGLTYGFYYQCLISGLFFASISLFFLLIFPIGVSIYWVVSLVIVYLTMIPLAIICVRNKAINKILEVISIFASLFH